MTVSAPTRISRGFTLVELIVAIVVVAVLAAVAAPRLFVTDDRRALIEARDAAGLLSIIAQRAGHGSHHMALVYEQEKRELRLEALRVLGERRNLQQRGAPRWGTDRLAPTVGLSAVRLVDARFDGRRPENERSWRVEFVPGVARAHVEILLATGTSNEPRWLLELLPYSAEPRLVDVSGGRRDEGVLRSLDLDALGRSDVPW